MMVPFIKKKQAQSFMAIFEKTLLAPPSNSIFRKNINPLRLGLVFYSVLDDFEKQFDNLIYSCQILKNVLLKQLLRIFEKYNDPNVLIPLIEDKDYQGKDIFYYFHRYDLTIILQTKIMDRFLCDKWDGRQEI